MDHRRVLIALLLAAPLLVLAAQAGPVYTASPPYPVSGGTCSIGRVQIERDSGKRWCCAAGTWAACGEVVDDGTSLVASKPVTTPSLKITASNPTPGVVSPNGPLMINRTDTDAYFPALVLRNGVAGVTNPSNFNPGAEIRFEGIDPTTGVVFAAGWFEVSNYVDALGPGLSTAKMTMLPQCGISTGCAGGTYSSAGSGVFLAPQGIVIGPEPGTIPSAGTRISASYRATVTADLASIAANTCSDTLLSVASAAIGAECSVSMPAAPSAGLSWGCYVSAAGTVKLRICNVTTAAVDPASATYSVRVWNP